MSQQRFLTLADVAEILSISVPQARAMVRSGELPAIQVGGRGQWRVETVKLEEYIQQGYERTERGRQREGCGELLRRGDRPVTHVGEHVDG